MLYDRIGGPIRSFHEDQNSYAFRYFCGDNLIPVQQSFPKSEPYHSCECKTLMFIEKDSKVGGCDFKKLPSDTSRLSCAVENTLASRCSNRATAQIRGV
jgi:hypothetical protein